ncbi:CPBP family intramembrane glutamic endopeptidase [Paenibacillus silvisoli]|uniref:CPBP family intramembrane glutamic endopeptidase n=1 Tax=Paenibacillus silvisoli TaxID=3110539 RepID=UPI00280428C8|nr:CPBP family intramembrane glutamic endopeptidase [Paenibacillus silvisoli]
MIRYAGMLGNYLLYTAMIIMAILVYNLIVNPIFDWGQFGKGDQLPAQVFIVLVVSIVLSWLAYTLKYRILKTPPPSSFIRLHQYLPIRLPQSIHMITVGLAFALLFTSAMKLLLHQGMSELEDFTAQYSNVPALYLITSAALNTALELVLFMGVMFNEARRRVPGFWAMLIISLIIAALQPGGIAMQLLGIPLGFLYGYMYSKLKSIWYVILIGCSFNVIFFTMVKTSLFGSFDDLSDMTLLLIALGSVVYMVISAVWYGLRAAPNP